MKKYLQFLLALALFLGVIGLARTGPAWAGMFRPADEPILFSPLIPSSVIHAPMAFETTLEEDTTGLNIGGVCLVDIDFKNAAKQMKVEADARVPLDESRQVAFNVPGFDLFFPGCRLIHHERDAAENNFEITQTIASEDAAARVCFGANPDHEMKIFYYFDLPGVPRVWREINSRLEDQGRLVCADAPHSAVYMPAGRISPRPGSEQPGANPLFPDVVGGTVRPPASRISFSASGEYAVGGVCIIRALYNVDGLSNEVWVAHEEEESLAVPFPGYAQGDLLYFPGCHVAHYRNANPREQMNVDEQEGEWEICFAARPGKQMTIYYYRGGETPSWGPLETTVTGGLACAKQVDFTAVYIPAGR